MSAHRPAFLRLAALAGVLALSACSGILPKSEPQLGRGERTTNVRVDRSGA